MKNKKIIILSLVLLLGLTTQSKQNEDMPEDEKLSSGYSVIRGNMVKINNYANVVNYAYSLQQKKKVKRNEYLLKELDFAFWEEISVFEEEQYPQGLCITEEFVFVSSYSGIKNELGRIYVFDRHSGEYLISLGMDEKSHLGGITYDGKNIWICNSSKMSIERLSYSFVCELTKQNKGMLIDARNLVDIYHVGNIPSSITFYDDILWIPSHSIWTNSKMIGYQFSEKNNDLISMESVRIPPKVQGIAFTDEGEVYLSTSYGRKNSSYIKKYNSMHQMNEAVDICSEMIELPPCSEGIVYKESRLYVLFESAGKKYLEGTDGKGKSLSPIDRILMITR